MSKSLTIGFQTPWLFGHYFSDILAGVQRVARRCEAQLIAVQENNPHTQALGIAAPPFSLDNVAGWVIMQETTLAPAIVRAGRPLVAISVRPEGIDCPMVVCDNKGGIRNAVHHLIDHGHRRIAFLGTDHYAEAALRFEGYRDALSEAGIPFDPQLAITVVSHTDYNTYLAAIETTTKSMATVAHQFSACVACDDDLAISLVRALQAAGLRVPEDVAVIGFNDIPDAQHLTPPLTTVSQGFDNLGSTAAELLMSMLAGDSVPSVTYVPTKLSVRRSCGCNTGDLLGAASHGPAADWQTDLARRLIGPLLFPATLPESTPPTELWPSVTTLTQAIAAACEGKLPLQETCQQAFADALAIKSDFKALRAVMALLEEAAHQRIGGEAQQGSALLNIFHIALLYAYREHEQAAVRLSDTLLQVNVTINESLFGNKLDEIWALGWLERTPVTWGALALWNESGAQQGSLRVIGAYSKDPQALLAVHSHHAVERFPPADRLPASTRDGGPDTIKLLPVWSDEHNWGVLALCVPLWLEPLLLQKGRLGGMYQWMTLLANAMDYQRLQATLAERQAQLQHAYAQASALSQTVRDLGSPVIPLMPGVLLVPLIGVIDSQRAQQISERVLEGIDAMRATTVLLDVTGVPLIDTQVANSLIQTAKAAMLLGASVGLVGVRPEIAQSIVGLGLQLPGITAYATLASAIPLLKSGQAAGRTHKA